MDAYDLKVIDELRSLAIAWETDLANTLRYYLNRYNQQGKFTQYLQLTDNTTFLRKVITDLLLQTDNILQVNRNNVISQINPANNKSGLTISKIPYTIGGQTYYLSKARCNDIRDLINRNGGWQAFNNNTDNLQTRVVGIVWEEVGERVMQDNFTQLSNNLNQNTDWITSPEKSTDWHWDTNMLIGVITEGNPNHDDPMDTLWIVGAKTIFKDWKFDHKMNLNRFHIADVDLSSDKIDLVRIIGMGLGIKNFIINQILIERIYKLYPTFYTVTGNSFDILLSSELLANGDNINVRGLNPNITALAQQIYDSIQSRDKDLHEEEGDIKQFLLNETIEKLERMNMKSQVWYGR